MINFIETLIAITVVSLVSAIVAHVRNRKAGARRFGWCALVCGALAAALEVYVRL
jgi:hypothetical protein